MAGDRYSFPAEAREEGRLMERRIPACSVWAILVIVCVIPVCYPFPTVTLKVLYSFRTRSLWVAADRFKPSAVPPLVEIVRKLARGLGIAPGEATPGYTTRSAFPFSLGRQALSRPFTVGVYVVPVDVDHRMVLEGIGDGVSLPKRQRLVSWVLRNSVAGCLDELQIPAVGDLIDVQVKGVEVDPPFRVLVPAPIAVAEGCPHQKFTCWAQAHRRSVLACHGWGKLVWVGDQRRSQNQTS